MVIRILRSLSRLRMWMRQRRIERKINEYLVKWALQQGIEEKYAPVVKLEKIYRRIVFKRKGDSDEAAKKRYAGHLIWKDGI